MQCPHNLNMKDDDQTMAGYPQEVTIQRRDSKRIGWFSLPREIKDKIIVEYV